MCCRTWKWDSSPPAASLDIVAHWVFRKCWKGTARAAPCNLALLAAGLQWARTTPEAWLPQRSGLGPWRAHLRAAPHPPSWPRWPPKWRNWPHPLPPRAAPDAWAPPAATPAHKHAHAAPSHGSSTPVSVRKACERYDSGILQWGI